jgi:CheY-like chemotaxis protein
MVDRETILKIREIGANFTVLYVEDEKDISEMVSDILRQFFKKVYVAKNGAEGLEIFKKEQINMVLTDIEMPVMNGLEMTKKIREISYDVPIGIISAFNETDKFITAIKNGVNRYLLKPIEMESVLRTLHDMLRFLEDKLNAKKYHEKMQQERINTTVKEMSEYFLQSIPCPIFVLNAENRVVYINGLFAKMLADHDIGIGPGDDAKKIENLFRYEEGTEISFGAVNEEAATNKKIIYKKGKESIYFLPQKREVELSVATNDVKYIIILNDVTQEMKQIRIIEYQKQKLQANNELLEEFLDENVFAQTLQEDDNTQQNMQTDTEVQESETVAKRRIYKISAENYFEVFQDAIIPKLEALNTLELDLQSELYKFEYLKSCEALDRIADIFLRYSNELKDLAEFSDFAESLQAIAAYFKSLTQKHMDYDTNIIAAALQSVIDDLKNWNERVFITQKAEDIHYLDNVLYKTLFGLKNFFENNMP